MGVGVEVERGKEPEGYIENTLVRGGVVHRSLRVFRGVVAK